MLARLIELSVERRLGVLAVTALIAAYGAHAYLQTPVEAFPDVTNLQVNVICQMPGLAPPEIERQVTIPLERAINGTPQMIGMRSESLFGLSILYLTFEDGADSFRARSLVTERLSRADLPEGVTPELGPDATPLGQIFQYHVLSDRHSLGEIRSEQEWRIAPAIRQLPGVADVVTRGGFLREILVEVDPVRLESHGLALQDVEEALDQASGNVGGGFLRRGDQQLVVRGVGLFQSTDDVGAVVIATDEGVPVTLRDVATISLSHTPRQGAVGNDLDREIVEGVVYMRRGENPSVVLDAIHARVAELEAGGLPEGMHLETFYDRSRLVDLTLHTVHDSLMEGALLVVALVWLFVRSLKGALVVGIVIPLALLGAFIGLHAIGLPANLISMGAIDFGILVDGGVILVETLFHRIHEAEARGEPVTDAASFRKALVASSVSIARPTAFAMAIIIAALIPVFSLERVEGRIFRPLALTYTFALIGALIFALTTVPALCAYVLQPKPGKRAHAEPGFVRWIRTGYAWLLERFLARSAAPLVVVAAMLAVAALTFPRLGTEFLPELDEGDLLVFVEMPSSIALEPGQDILAEARRRVLTLPEVLEVETQQGRPEDGTDNESVNMAEMPVRLRPREEWRPGWDTERLTDAIREQLEGIPGIRFNFSQPMRDNVEEAISGVRGKVVLKIFGTDLTAMRQTLLDAVELLEQVPGITDLSLYRDRAVPQLEIRLDRPSLARAGLSIARVDQTIETALSGRVATELWEGERSVPVRLRLARTAREDVDRIGDVRVHSPTGAQLRIRDLAVLDVTPGRASINREGGRRSMALKFNVEGRDVGSVVHDAMDAVSHGITPPEGNTLVWAGEFENQQRAMHRLSIVVPLSLLAVFVLLVAALGTARGAVAVMVISPVCLVGGGLALLATGTPLSVSAAIGFIALLGQISLASLLVLSAIEERRKAGAPLEEAIREGAVERVRAVVLTALLAMLGLMPMALGNAVGSETQRPFALVLIGGVASTVIVVLFVLPSVYRAIAKIGGGKRAVE